MNIQISLVIWTVICFFILYLVLKYLLFRPVLDTMDKRNKKINDAAQKQLDAEKAAKEKLAADEEAAKERLLKAEADAKAKAEIVRLEGKKWLEEAKRQNVAEINAYREKSESEYISDIKDSNEKMSELAVAFLDNLFAN